MMLETTRYIVASALKKSMRSNRLTAAGEIIGDARYSSPEQIRGEPVTTASDVYSLGILVYKC